MLSDKDIREAIEKGNERVNRIYGGNETMRITERGGLYRLTRRQHSYEQSLYSKEGVFMKVLRFFGLIEPIDVRMIKIPEDFQE